MNFSRVYRDLLFSTRFELVISRLASCILMGLSSLCFFSFFLFFILAKSIFICRTNCRLGCGLGSAYFHFCICFFCFYHWCIRFCVVLILVYVVCVFCYIWVRLWYHYHHYLHRRINHAHIYARILWNLWMSGNTCPLSRTSIYR